MSDPVRTYMILHKNGTHATQRPASEFGVFDPGGNTPESAWRAFCKLVTRHGGQPQRSDAYVAVAADIYPDRVEFDWADLHQLGEVVSPEGS